MLMLPGYGMLNTPPLGPGPPIFADCPAGPVIVRLLPIGAVIVAPALVLPAILVSLMLFKFNCGVETYRAPVW